MALPVLNTTPTYELIVPSTGKKVKFRPFLVKEQKILLVAFESKDKRSIVRAILDVIGACVSDINPYKLTTFDIDFIFTKIRAKSVGEQVDLIIPCSNCEAENKVSFSIDDIKLDMVEHDKIIKITDDISIKLKYPDYDFFMKNSTLDEALSSADLMIDVVISCMESIQTPDENISLVDEKKEEIVKFIDSLTSSQFEKISKFVESLPKLTHNLQFVCSECGSINSKLLEGLEDFF